MFVHPWQVPYKSFHLYILSFLNQKVRIDLLHLLFDQGFLYIRTFGLAVFDVAVVVNDFFLNFGQEVVIDPPCFACDAVDCFDYG